MSYHSKTAFFFKPAEVQSRTKFLNGVVCWLSDRSGSEEAERSCRSEATKLSGAQERSDKIVRSQRSESTKLSGARMPEQRRAGQLVDVYRLKESRSQIKHSRQIDRVRGDDVLAKEHFNFVLCVRA